MKTRTRPTMINKSRANRILSKLAKTIGYTHKERISGTTIIFSIDSRNTNIDLIN